MSARRCCDIGYETIVLRYLRDHDCTITKLSCCNMHRFMWAFTPVSQVNTALPTLSASTSGYVAIAMFASIGKVTESPDVKRSTIRRVAFSAFSARARRSAAHVEGSAGTGVAAPNREERTTYRGSGRRIDNDRGVVSTRTKPALCSNE